MNVYSDEMMAATRREMAQQALLELLDLLETNAIEVWLDGGWAVDALLGVQTRPHEDVDIILAEADVGPLRALLAARGYVDVPRDDTRPCNFVMGNAQGEEVDFHAVLFDAYGNGAYDGVTAAFPAAGFGGVGKIGGRPVKCLTAAQIVEFHTQYTPDANDIRDVAALCAAFGIEYPSDYPPADPD